jgi:4,5-DOPA dioxygenase extradiol
VSNPPIWDRAAKDNAMTTMPALFISHGSPMLAIADGAAHRFLRGAAAGLPRPRAIVVASAHWATRMPAVGTAVAPRTIHDFGPFDPALFEIRYPAPGAPDVAAHAVALLEEAGFAVASDPDRGLDHGVWVPLSLLYPAADIPVVPLAVQPRQGPEHHLRIGRALAPLRDEGVLIVGSGSLTHNLHELDWQDAEAPVHDWVETFREWIATAAAEGRIDDLVAYRRLAPHAAANHPTDEHLLPLYVAFGAGGGAPSVRRIHKSDSHAALAMDAFAIA